MKDLFGQALYDYYNNSFEPPLLLHNEYGPPEVIPVESYFHEEDEFSDLEIYALHRSRGKVLDIGAATGRHAYYLQNNGFDVTALDISYSCGKLMKHIGIKKVIIDNIFNFSSLKYDTIFMLMNGIGIAGTIHGLKQLLQHLKKIITSDGQVIADSSNISYLYEGSKFPENIYFGELAFRYEYKKCLDDPFNWLYIDQKNLKRIAQATGWNCQIIFEDELDAFLAILQPE